MARPMILMQEYLLSMLWNKYTMGVPITTIIRQDNIPLTPPTLTKMFSYVDMLEEEVMKENPDMYQMIYNSLFPDWLTEKLGEDDWERLTEMINGQPNIKTTVLELLPSDLVIQPSGWTYKGLFPIGKWSYNKKEVTNVQSNGKESSKSVS